MRPVAAVAALLVTLLLSAPYGERVAASLGSIPAKCDRACLERVMDEFLAAVVARDPKRLPLSADARHTENAQVLQRARFGAWR